MTPITKETMAELGWNHIRVMRGTCDGWTKEFTRERGKVAGQFPSTTTFTLGNGTDNLFILSKISSLVKIEGEDGKDKPAICFCGFLNSIEELNLIMDMVYFNGFVKKDTAEYSH